MTFEFHATKETKIKEPNETKKYAQHKKTDRTKNREIAQTCKNQLKVNIHASNIPHSCCTSDYFVMSKRNTHD